MDFAEYDEIQAAKAARKQRVEAVEDQLIAENLEALQELWKWFFVQWCEIILPIKMIDCNREAFGLCDKGY